MTDELDFQTGDIRHWERLTGRTVFKTQGKGGGFIRVDGVWFEGGGESGRAGGGQRKEQPSQPDERINRLPLAEAGSKTASRRGEKAVLQTNTFALGNSRQSEYGLRFAHSSRVRIAMPSSAHS
jgi:hypothetical protein